MNYPMNVYLLGAFTGSSLHVPECPILFFVFINDRWRTGFYEFSLMVNFMMQKTNKQNVWKILMPPPPDAPSTALLPLSCILGIQN